MAIQIMMGVNPLHKIASYWSSKPQLNNRWISSTMTKTRYMKINQYLHAANNEEIVPRGQEGYDPCAKLRRILIHVRSRFAEHFKAGKNLSADEAMIPYTGRSCFKQYMPNKPTKFGIKVWMLCDASTGYCLNYDVYPGRQYRAGPNGLGYEVVTKLLSEYMGKHHHVFFDRFFTGIPLVEFLLRQNTYACGTIMTNRKGVPKEVKSAKLKKGETSVYEKRDSGSTCFPKIHIHISSGRNRGSNAVCTC